tara:strand:- start:482 stop:676 length:195 start_codon:yes stop_codon:yes gene_type:complete
MKIDAEGSRIIIKLIRWSAKNSLIVRQVLNKEERGYLIALLKDIDKEQGSDSSEGRNEEHSMGS